MKPFLAFISILLLSFKLPAQVNLQTGSATFSLPIFNWQDDKSRLNTAISLNYNSGNGLKVNDVSSNIGQGWSMLEGGVITRSQVGEPDDQLARAGVEYNDINKYPPGYLYNSKNPSDGCPESVYKYPIFEDPNTYYSPLNSAGADRELDYFNFRINGRSGQFVLGKNNGDKGITLGDSKLKIWFDRNRTSVMTAMHVRTTISAFFIQDESGLIYRFKDIALSKITTTSQSSGNPETRTREFIYSYDSYVSGIPYVEDPYIVNGWYLSEIYDPLTQRSVLFNYTVRTISTYGGASINLYATPFDVDPQYTAGGSTLSVAPKINIVANFKKVSGTQPVLNTITCPNGFQVIYQYGDVRIDWQGDYTLKSVLVKYNSRINFQYDFEQTYFIFNSYGLPQTDIEKRSARLCLRSVKRLSVDGKEYDKPYYFDYYTGSSAPDDFVPPPFFYLKDIYGYYNGDYCFKQPNGNYYTNIDNGQPIIIPYQGYLQNLDFWQMTFLCFSPNGNVRTTAMIVRPKQGYAKNGLLKTIKYPTGGTFTYSYLQNEANVGGTNKLVGGVSVNTTILSAQDGSSDQIIDYYYLSENNTSSLWGYESPTNVQDTKSFYRREAKSQHLFNCSWGITYPGLQRNISVSPAQKSKTSWGDATASLAKDIFVTLANFPTSYTIIIKAFITVTSFISSCEDVERFARTSCLTNENLNDVNPLPTQYKRTLVTPRGILSNNGKIIYEFTSGSDYGVWLSQNPSFSRSQRYAPWVYGIPKTIEVQNLAGQPIKKTVYNYDFTNISLKTGIDPLVSNQSCQCQVQQAHSQNIYDWYATETSNSTTYFTSSNADVSVNYYNLYTGRLELSNSHEYVYKPTDKDSYVETITNYEYNASNFQVKKVTSIQNNGDRYITETFYPADYSTNGILQTMVTNNIVSTPIATYKSIQKNGTSTPVFTNAAVTKFGVISNGDIKPVETFIGQSSSPITSFQFSSADPYNYPDLNSAGTINYNSNGTIASVADEGLHQSSVIYGYDDRFAIASITNASTADKAAYTSFEDNNFSAWVKSPSDVPSYTSINSITGSRALLLNSVTSLTASINNTKSYILSFWSSNVSGVQLSPACTLLKTGLAINGATYYQYEVPAGNSSIVISSATAGVTLDELRLYPKAARMQTVTYDPLVGKTSECDVNDRVTYYEYDGLDRLRFVKDDKGNIVKMYEYNSKQ